MTRVPTPTGTGTVGTSYGLVAGFSTAAGMVRAGVPVNGLSGVETIHTTTSIRITAAEITAPIR
jgi:hypothetical protein